MENTLKKMAAAGLSGSLAGQRTAKLFNKIEKASFEISKRCPKSIDEITKIIINKCETTTLTPDQAIEETRIEIFSDGYLKTLQR